MRLERSDHLCALDLHFERPIAELHGDDGPFLLAQLSEQRWHLADQTLLGGRFVQRIETRLADEDLGDELPHCLMQIEHAMTQGDLVATALEARAVTARILQHCE